MAAQSTQFDWLSLRIMVHLHLSALESESTELFF